MMGFDEMLVQIRDVRRMLSRALPTNVTTTAIDFYLQQLPIADIPVEQGEWVWDESRRCWECDQCGETTTESVMNKPRFRFCPWCGADMRKENDND